MTSAIAAPAAGGAPAAVLVRPGALVIVATVGEDEDVVSADEDG
jgi:hypothetical protein